MQKPRIEYIYTQIHISINDDILDESLQFRPFLLSLCFFMREEIRKDVGKRMINSLQKEIHEKYTTSFSNGVLSTSAGVGVHVLVCFSQLSIYIYILIWVHNIYFEYLSKFFNLISIRSMLIKTFLR